MADGEEVNGCQIEGLRTEASFFYELKSNSKALSNTTSLKQTHVTRIDSVKISLKDKQILQRVSRWTILATKLWTLKPQVDVKET